MSDLVKRARHTALYEGSGEESDLHEQMADRIEALEAQVAAADALADRGCVLALRLTHVVGRESIVERWDAALAAYRATKEGQSE